MFIFYNLETHTYQRSHMDTKKIIWDNVRNLMIKRYGKENINKTYLDSNKKISLGALQRIKAQQTAIGIDVLDNIAEFFEVQTWHLLLMNLDVHNPPVILMTKVEQDFYQKMNEIVNNKERIVQ